MKDEGFAPDPGLTPRTLNKYTLARERFFGPGGDRKWEAEEQAEGKPLPYFRGSKLGGCPRAQILHRSGMKSARPIDEKGRRRMEAGLDVERDERGRFAAEGLLLGSNILMADPELAVEGHLDILWGGEVQPEPEWWFYRDPDWVDFLRQLRKEMREDEPYPVTQTEIKSVASYAFTGDRIPKTGRQDHMMQCAGYYLLGVKHLEALGYPLPDRWEVLLYNRDTGARRIIPLTESWVERTEERIDLLNEGWATGDWPACTCSDPEPLGYLERNYCNFPNPDGDGCCGTTLLDILERSVEQAKAKKEGQLSLEGGTDAADATA